MSSLAALEDAPPPGGPMLDMDWDDEDMSTRIYDRPEDMPGGSGAYEQVNAGFEEVGQGSQGQISTYVPPVNGADAQSMYVSPRAYVRSEPPGRSQPPFGSPTPLAAQPPLSPPPTIGSQPPRSARVASVTQPIATQTATEKGRNPLFAALAVAVVGALCFAAYVYLAKSLPGVVQLSTHPVDASVSFDGKPIGSSSPFVVTGVSPGETHVLEVRKSGYHPWSQEVMVQPGQTLTFPVTLEPDGTVAPAATDSNAPIAATPTPASTGGFSIESTPPGATVFLDDTLLPNVTPMRIANLVPRRYSVRVQLANYHEYKTEVDVHSGDDRVLPRIILLPERIRVRITSEPGHADATVVRGGERRALGKTPLDVTLDNNGSPWRLELSRDDFETYKKELAIDQALLAVDAALLKNDARAERSARPSRASEPRPARAPEPRPARVASAAPAVPAAASPDSSGEGTSPSPSPQASAGAGNGTLRINSRPWSQVYVDGKLIGSTPQLNISLSPGPHRVMLLNSVFNVKKNLTVKIVAGKVETQIINLQ